MNIKKQIYEQIMRSIAKEVRKVLNESAIMNNFLSKESQVELKERYKNSIIEFVLSKRKSFNDKDIKYYVDDYAYFIPICNEQFIVGIKKEEIKKDFCFGYSQIGQGESFEEVHQAMNSIQKQKENYFIEKNLEDIDEEIEKLESALNDTPTSRYSYYHAYYGNSNGINPNCAAMGLYVARSKNDFYGASNYEELGKEDIKNVIIAYKRYREDFIKKLGTYLKKYGVSKLRMWSYCSDD